ncbi:AT hook domain-containing protein [Diplocarpon rosae]|nr:AT hook domain-containing protein [Diplocarpon rosae]
MPSQTHPQAQFVPVPPDFDLPALVESCDNFDYVTRLSTEKLEEHSIQSFEALILAVVIQSGKPLVIEDWGEVLPPWLFSKGWLERNLGTKPEQVRDIPNEVNIPMTMGHYLRSMDQLTKQFTKDNFRDPKRQRLYMKDIDCPDVWAEQLKSIIPECIYYLNECIESRTGGDGAVLEPNEYGQMRYGKGVAPAGDLMSSLPPEMRALNMMCYIGHEGTYTATHREMCATLGHNIMVNASRNGSDEIEGSSVWFMTETKEREVVSEYFLSMLGHDIEVEKHFAQVNAWKKAPFNVWVVEQKVGDLILIPPLAPHQVWNRGTRTMKVAWNRTTVDTLELALHEALPRARMVCRDEQYKCKAIVYYTLVKYYELLQRDTIQPKMWKYGRIKQLLEDFRRLFSLYQEVLVSEMFSPKLPEEKDVEMVPFDSNVTCSYCRLNIFNRFLTCKSCILYGDNGEEDTYDICMDCYAMGRSCACISALNWVEQWDWQILVNNYELWRSVVVKFDGYFDTMRSPQVLDVARKRYGKKPIAEVCQEQLRRRPWTDITKPKELTPDISDVEPEVDDEGRIKVRKGGKKNGTRRNRLTLIKGKTHSCHICFHQEWNWKLAFCTTCKSAYCYGVLWRAFDLMPQTVMEDKDWQCPKCIKICSCAKCRKGNMQKPYQPKGTLLGHDTRKVADHRSVESLVDFSKTNLCWLRDNNAENPQESSRMKKLKEKAEADKAKVDLVDQGYAANGADSDPFAGTPVDVDPDMDVNAALSGHGRDMQYIDPSLRGPEQMASISNGSVNIHDEGPNDLATLTQSGHDDFTLDGKVGDDIQDALVDSQYDFDDYYLANAQSASYPARLLAPVAPMGTSAPTQAPTREEHAETTVPVEPAASSYLDPSNVAQNRMMGIGYYQQGDDADKILYDPPNMDESFEQLPQPSLAQNPNLALSDLLRPALQPSEAKKRKQLENDDDGEQDEFFTTKRQKIRALTKKHKSYSEKVSSGISRPEPEKRLPRRSTGKLKSYTDLDEDVMFIEDDEANLIPAFSYERKRKGDNSHSDLELATQAMNNLSEPKAKKGQPKAPSRAAAPRRNTIKTPRKSAWLTCKEAGEIEAEVSSFDPSRKTRRRRTKEANKISKSNFDVIGTSSGASSHSDAGVSVNYSDINREKDGLFGEPLGCDNTSEKVATNGSKIDRTKSSNEVSNLQLNSKGSVSEDESDLENSVKPTPKRRGRPRQQIDNSDIEIKDKPTPKQRGQLPRQLAFAKEPDSPPTVPVTAPKMLSLKEKLALKGKSCKIVGKSKASPGTPCRPPNIHSTPKTMSTSTLKRPSVVISISSNSVDKKPYAAHTSSEDSPVVKPADMPIDQTASISTYGPPQGTDISNPKETSISTSGHLQSEMPAPPQRKGPTVVRLVSPDSDCEEDNIFPLVHESLSSEDSSSDDDDIPARLFPKTVRGDTALRDRPGANAARRGLSTVRM